MDSNLPTQPVWSKSDLRRPSSEARVLIEVDPVRSPVRDARALSLRLWLESTAVLGEVPINGETYARLLARGYTRRDVTSGLDALARAGAIELRAAPGLVIARLVDGGSR